MHVATRERELFSLSLVVEREQVVGVSVAVTRLVLANPNEQRAIDDIDNVSVNNNNNNDHANNDSNQDTMLDLQDKLGLFAPVEHCQNRKVQSAVRELDAHNSTRDQRLLVAVHIHRLERFGHHAQAVLVLSEDHLVKCKRHQQPNKTTTRFSFLI